MKNYTAIIALALALPAGLALAQSPEDRPPGPPPGEGPQGARPQGDQPEGGRERPGRPHVPPIIAALDKNGDGVISEDEIAAAADSLRKLDKNHTGKLTIEDLLGPPPRGARPGGARPRGPREKGQRTGPRERAAAEQGGPRGESAPRPEEDPGAGAWRQHSDARHREGIAGNRDGFIPLPMPPRGDFGPRDGEVRTRAFSQRDGGPRPDFDRPNERPFARPDRRHERPMPPPMPPRDGFGPPPRSPRDGEPRPRAGGPRDGEARPEARGPRDGVPPGGGPRGEGPRDGARPESDLRDDGARPERNAPPRGDRPPGDAPRPDSEPPRPDPEG